MSRGLDAGNVGKTDVVKPVLKRGLCQTEPEYMGALTAGFGIEEPAVDYAHDSDDENTGHREAYTRVHPDIRYRGSIHIKQPVADLDAGKRAAPQKTGKHCKRNGNDGTAEN